IAGRRAHATPTRATPTRATGSGTAGSVARRRVRAVPFWSAGRRREDVGERVEQLVAGEGLGEVAVEAGLEDALVVAGEGVGGDGEGGDVGVGRDGAQRAQEVEP